MQAAAAPGVHQDDLDGARARIALTALAAFTAIAAAQLADLTTFLRMIAVGGLAAEANPIVAHLGSSVGLEILVLLKLALIPFAVLTVTALARVRTRLAASVLTFATLAGLLGAFTNILAFA